MSEETYEGVPRSKIPWGPKIDYEKCVTCGKCVDFCHMGAFELQEKNEPWLKIQAHVSCSVEAAKTSALPTPSRIHQKRKPEK